jgi:hypothetical protein
MDRKGDMTQLLWQPIRRNRLRSVEYLTRLGKSNATWQNTNQTPSDSMEILLRVDYIVLNVANCLLLVDILEFFSK